MIYENLPRGQAKIVSYIPTIPAIRYLNCCTMAGWHHCNELYRMNYQNGGLELLLIYTIDGKGKMNVDGKTYELCKDSIVIVPPHTPMNYSTDPQVGFWEFYWLDLTGDRILSIATKLYQDDHCFVRKTASLSYLFAALLKESSSESERSALIGQIFDEIVSEAIFNGDQKKSFNDRILRYISEHYKEHLDLQQLANHFYLSQNQIIRIIRARTGYTPHEYLVHFRLSKACELLQGTQVPIGEIGRAVGYDNNSHFSATFRKIYGLTPAEYRALFSK